mgnify:CR=1 FL=1
MSYLCNRNRETKIDNNKVPWMSGLVSGLQNRVRRFESARNLNDKTLITDKQVVSVLLLPKTKKCYHSVTMAYLLLS